MKAKKITLLSFVLFFLFIKNISAQLPGGTYTIGGASPDYPTIAAAISAMSAGISGPVIFNIRPGNYIETNTIASITGSSALNTITFQAENGDSTSVVITDSSNSSGLNNWTLFILGTDYLVLRHLTIERSGSLPYSTVLYIGSNSRNLQVRNCIIQNNYNSGNNNNSTLVNLPAATSTDSSIVLSDNIFNNGYLGINVNSTNLSQIPLLQLTNNYFNNQNEGAVYLFNSSKPTISGNHITTANATASYKGIALRRVTNDYKVLKNFITAISQGQAISLDTSSGNPGTEALVANNFIQTQGNTNVTGIYLSQCSSINIFYNTVNITGTNINSAALRFNNSSNSLIRIKNNILINTGSGYTFYVAPGAMGNITSSDYNDLMVGPSSINFAFADTGNALTFADWKAATALDSHSVSGDPQFVSSVDLHVGSPVVNDVGTVVAGVTTDIDGDPRSVSNPDIGADEFTPLLDNIGLIGFVSPTFINCGDSVSIIGVILKNYGLSTQSGFNFHVDITGTITQTISEPYNNSLSSNSSDTVYFTQFLNTYDGDTITIKAYSSLAGDQNNLNDTITGLFYFNGHPNAPAVSSPQQQCDNSIHIIATPDSGNTLAWFAQPIGGYPLYIGSDFSPAITGDTTFYVESRTGNGTLTCLRITEIDVLYDYMEIQNLSGSYLDATGYQVIASNDYTDINLKNDSTWKLGVFNPNQIQYRTDNFTDNYWGLNLVWEPGPAYPGWAMIIDDHYTIVDFVSWGWISDSINALSIIVDGHTITVGSEWFGDGFIWCAGTDNMQRFGTDENNMATDFSCAVPTKGIQNANIQQNFFGCGVGVCGSLRVPVDIHLVPGVTTNLGNDTILTNSNPITLDAGPGFGSYLWSTGDTTKTIIVYVADTFWVTVTDSLYGCSFTDSIIIDITIGISAEISNDEIQFYPNPARDKIMINGNDKILNSAIIQVFDLQGKMMNIARQRIESNQTLIRLNDFEDGIYFLRIISGDNTGVRRFTVVH